MKTLTKLFLFSSLLVCPQVSVNLVIVKPQLTKAGEGIKINHSVTMQIFHQDLIIQFCKLLLANTSSKLFA